MNPKSSARFREEKRKDTLLVITKDSPQSYSPSGERIIHTALASSLFFERVIVLSLCGVRKRGWHRQRDHEHNSRVLLYAVNFVRGMLYPLVDIFDPIRFLVFLVHGFIMTKRYKPLCIFASMPPFETGASAWLLSKLKPSILVIDLRDDWEASVGTQLRRYFPAVIFNVLTTITNKIYSDAFVIFTATQTIAGSIRKRGVDTQIALVPNGADTSVFLPENESDRSKIRMKYKLPLDKVIAVYCGSGTASYYRLDRVLSSVKLLSQEVKDRIYVVFYVFSGSKKLQRMQRELEISDNVLEIRDPLPRKSLAEVLGVCDVGLLPFDDAAYLLCARSTKLYEYLSSGLYVISSGPKGGELEALFSDNPAFGLFIHPSAKNFAVSVRHVLKKGKNLFSGDLRRLRHSFVEKHYNRKAIMKKAMKTLLECVEGTVNLSCIQNRDDDEFGEIFLDGKK